MSCKALGLSQSIELTDLSTTEIDEASSELDLNEAYDQLERMKQRVLQMKSMIVRPPATATDQVMVEFEKQADSDNVHLGEVQLETSGGFRQIDLVRMRLADTTKELGTLAARIQERDRCTKELAKKLDRVPQWIEDFKHQMGLCLERHNELDTTLCSEIDYSTLMRPLLVTLNRSFGSKVSIACFQKQYTIVLNYMNGTRMLLNRTHAQLMEFTQLLNNSLVKLSTQPLPNLADIIDLIEMLEQNQQREKSKKASQKVSKSRASLHLNEAIARLRLLEQSGKVYRASN